MADYHYYQACIDACLHCASICNHCAASCTQEKDVKMMARCIQLDMECAAICYGEQSCYEKAGRGFALYLKATIFNMSDSH